jgi:hypothetical protein
VRIRERYLQRCFWPADVVYGCLTSMVRMVTWKGRTSGERIHQWQKLSEPNINSLQYLSITYPLSSFVQVVFLNLLPLPSVSLLLGLLV